MLDKDLVEKIMKERGYSTHSFSKNTKIVFMPTNTFCLDNIKSKQPTISVVIDLQNEEFEGIYSLSHSINILTTTKCGSVLNDNHFNNIIDKLKEQARILKINGF